MAHQTAHRANSSSRMHIVRVCNNVVSTFDVVKFWLEFIKEKTPPKNSLFSEKGEAMCETTMISVNVYPCTQKHGTIFL
jgi:hypothetical protein